MSSLIDDSLFYSRVRPARLRFWVTISLPFIDRCDRYIQYSFSHRQGPPGKLTCGRGRLGYRTCRAALILWIAAVIEVYWSNKDSRSTIVTSIHGVWFCGGSWTEEVSVGMMSEAKKWRREEGRKKYAPRSPCYEFGYRRLAKTQEIQESTALYISLFGSSIFCLLAVDWSKQIAGIYPIIWLRNSGTSNPKTFVYIFWPRLSFFDCLPLAVQTHQIHRVLHTSIHRQHACTSLLPLSAHTNLT
jgi:hypothetical protein